jgi:hypothetical protein
VLDPELSEYTGSRAQILGNSTDHEKKQTSACAIEASTSNSVMTCGRDRSLAGFDRYFTAAVAATRPRELQSHETIWKPGKQKDINGRQTQVEFQKIEVRNVF